MCKTNHKSKKKAEGERGEKKDYQLGADNQKKLSLRLICYSVFIIIATLVVLSFAQCLPPWLKLVFEIASGIAASVLAGAIVAYTADIPSLISSFKKLIIDSLISNSYLENIDKDQLKSIKKTVVKNLHKDVELPESLLQLDANLGDMFDNPYYSFFNEIVFCHKKGAFAEVSAMMEESGKSSTLAAKSNPPRKDQAIDDTERYVLKDITNEFEIINPTTKEIIADIGIRKTFDLPPGRTTEDLFLLQQFEVTIDGGKAVDIGVDVETFKKQSVKRSSPETMTYDSTMGIALKDTTQGKELTSMNLSFHERRSDPKFLPRTSDSPCQLNVKFDKSVRVVLKYRMIVPERDNHFTRRMRYSAESFLLNYYCEDKVQIHGQVLGTLVKQEKITIVQDDNHKNGILIQCRGWLLPGNGIFVVLDDK